MNFEEIRKLAREYYSRKDIQKCLVEFARGREVVPKYIEQFGKRPDTINYENDLISLIQKGVTSFHSSEELWSNPLELNTEMNESKANSLRKGWDLILDIDCKFVEYSKIAAELLVEALNFNGVANMGIKYSGNKGFHLGLSFAAFPERVNDINVKDFFPDGPRIIAAYLSDLIKKHLAKRILQTAKLSDIAKGFQKKESDLIKNNEFDPYSILDIDTILISPRHLFRMPYSLHEKTGLVSIVITPKQLKDFHPAWAKPERITPKQFLPVPEKDEAKKLLIQALDWNSHQQKRNVLEKPKQEYDSNHDEFALKDVNPEFYPPCIKKALLGMKEDGRKRALFVLINFFKSLNMDADEIQSKIEAWDKLNYKPLKRGYIITQLLWHKKQKTILPPNCDKQYYTGIGICAPDFFCKRTKNPVNYIRHRLRLEKQQKEAEPKPKKRGKRNSAEIKNPMDIS